MATNKPDGMLVVPDVLHACMCDGRIKEEKRKLIIRMRFEKLKKEAEVMVLCACASG